MVSQSFVFQTNSLLSNCLNSNIRLVDLFSDSDVSLPSATDRMDILTPKPTTGISYPVTNLAVEESDERAIFGYIVLYG